ncbi:diiron oxygenase [Moorena sp. SIO3H5]|uniref:diiron oxygenase n=1 Tax=Moorena sp. SIO3H5 TaxID=2607834 RepID=UPI0013BA804B|nr:diiron oxygenase [Moorena sp. SIO3H5]NEO69842.1 diiron oxygenase [Moorena sp. SIO3H5]
MKIRNNQLKTTATLSVKDRKFNSHDNSHCRNFLQKISNKWPQRAQVKKQEPEAKFDPTLKDFRVDLLPFKNHPRFLEASEEVQNKILSCGWLAYNEKTIGIELKIVVPACSDIIYKNVPGTEDEISQKIAIETLTDEAFHVLLVNNACSITRKQRGLESLRLPDFNLVIKMRQEQDRWSEDWQKIIVQLVTAIVSEVFISDYLKLLAEDTTIQPFNRLTVEMHRRDEMAHSPIFKNLAKLVYSKLTKEQKEFFMEMLPKPVNWFANIELGVWEAMLDQIKFPHTKEVIGDCAKDNEVNLMRIDYNGVTKLAEELGILDSQRGFDSFAQANLLN